MSEKNTFENSIKELEKIVTDLEQNVSNIDDIINLHKKAVEKLEECEKILDEADQKIEVYKRNDK